MADSKELLDALDDAACLTDEELQAIAYVSDMVGRNPLAACQDSISKRHTKMVAAFQSAAVKLARGAERRWSARVTRP